MSKDNLILSAIYSKEDLTTLSEVMDMPIDTNKVQVLSPNKREFRKLLKRDGFSDLEVFKKIK